MLCVQLSINRGEDGLFKQLAQAENFSAACLHIHPIENVEFARIVIDLKADGIYADVWIIFHACDACFCADSEQHEQTQ